VGTLTAFLLLTSSAATPNWSVAVTGRTGIDTDAGLDLAEMLSVALGKHADQVPGKEVSARAFAATLLNANNPDSAACGGAVDCAAVVARQGAVDFLFAVQMVKVGQNVIFDVTLVRAVDGAAVATATKPVPFKKPVKAIGELAKDIAAKAKAMSEPLPQPAQATPPPPPPAVVASEPGPKSDEPIKVSNAQASDQPGASTEVRETQGTPVSRYVAIGLGVVAVGAAAGGVYFGVSASNAANNLRDKDPNLAKSQASVISTARTADIAYAVATAAAISAIVILVVSRPSSHASVSGGSGMDATTLRWDF
jgi:hypothetical protein